MMKEPPSYSTGEPITVGDLVRYDDDDGEVESVITDADPDWDSYWKDLGTGVMVKSPKYGRVYLPYNDEDLQLVRSAKTGYN